MPDPQVAVNPKRAVDDIKWCFSGLSYERETAVGIVARAARQGWLTQLERAWRETHSSDLHEFIMNRLHTYESQMGAYANMKFPQNAEAVKHAKEFYDRVSGPTVNKELRDFLYQVAGYDQEKGTIKSPEALLKMGEIFEACYARHYDNGDWTLRYAITYELTGTGFLSDALDLLDTCKMLVDRNEKAAKENAAKKAPAAVEAPKAAEKAPAAPVKDPGPKKVEPEKDPKGAVPSKKGLNEVGQAPAQVDELRALGLPRWGDPEVPGWIRKA